MTRCVLVGLFLLCSSALAVTHYVDLNSSNPVYPYTSWETAATNIQDAVDAAIDGDIVLVTNGTYSVGLPITITNSINVQSVNGPEVTIVDGRYSARGFYLGNVPCIISGLTITKCRFPNGAGVSCSGTLPVVTNSIFINNGSEDWGGGMSGGTANNCSFVGNYGGHNGGGMHQGIANNCEFIRNRASNGHHESFGAGMAGGIANNCTFISNSVSGTGGGFSGHGEGVSGGIANNCVFFRNSSSRGAGGMYEGTANNCTFTFNVGGTNSEIPPMDPVGGMAGGFANNCIFWHNSSLENFMGIFSIPHESNLSGTVAKYCCSPDVSHGVNGNITNNPVFIYENHIAEDSPCRGAGSSLYSSGTDFDGDSWLDPPSIGCNEYYAEYVDDRPIYVSGAGNDYDDGRSWATAKATIQSGVDAQLAPFGQVYVSNGTYVLDTAIEVDRAMSIAAVDGPDTTIIDGNQQVRCFNLSDYSITISGFTIQNGKDSGIQCAHVTPIVSNCVIRNTTGRGMNYGTAINCTFDRNSRGGKSLGPATNCIFTENTAGYGGGIFAGTADNCVFIGNFADEGGGMFYSTAKFCTIAENRADGWGGGVSEGTISHCIVWNNYSTYTTNSNLYKTFSTYTCSPDVSHGVNGNITNKPYLAHSTTGDCRLLPTSPCINAGNNSSVNSSMDIAGNPRISGIAVDMGAYEYQDEDSDLLLDAWEVYHYGSITNWATHDDPDQDRYDNLEELLAGGPYSLAGWNFMDPLEWGYYLEISNDSGFGFTWKMCNGTNYQIQTTTDLTSNSWDNVLGVIPGNETTDGYFSAPFDASERFYRVITVP